MADAGRSTTSKDPGAFRTIREVSELLDVPQHVLRFWETRFPELKPLQRGGNRRYYRPADVDFASALHKLLHQDGYTVKGVRKLISDHGAANLVGIASGQPVAPRGRKAAKGVTQPTPVIAAAAIAAQEAIGDMAGGPSASGVASDDEPIFEIEADPEPEPAWSGGPSQGAGAVDAPYVTASLKDLVRIRDRLAAALAS